MTMDPVTGTALIAGGTQLASSTMGAIGRKKQREWEEEQALKQRNWNLEQWHRQNEYNSPAQQIARLKAAGLNPALLYGQGVAGATGQAGAVQDYSRASGAESPLKAFEGIGQAGLSMANAMYSNELRAAQRLYIDRQADEKGKQNALLDVQLDAAGMAGDRFGVVKTGGFYDKDGKYMPGDYDKAVMSAKAKIAREHAEADLALKQVEWAEADRPLKRNMLEEAAHLAWNKNYDAWQQQEMRKQFLEFGPRALAEKLAAGLMGQGLSKDFAEGVAQFLAMFAANPNKYYK